MTWRGAGWTDWSVRRGGQTGGACAATDPRDEPEDDGWARDEGDDRSGEDDRTGEDDRLGEDDRPGEDDRLGGNDRLGDVREADGDDEGGYDDGRAAIRHGSAGKWVAGGSRRARGGTQVMLRAEGRAGLR